MTEKLCFTEDQAFQIILKGMETGQIKLPFHQEVSTKKMLELTGSRSEPISDAFSMCVALSRAAKRDSLYLLVLYRSLTSGIDGSDLASLDSSFDGWQR